MALRSMEAFISKAIEARHIPGAVLLAANKSRKFEYAKVMGSSSLAQAKPLSLDSVMWIASCTKLVTSIAAMQCVEKGLVKLDDDVRAIVPELQDLDILQADADGGIATTRKNDSPITMRQLLTHSSGFAYEFNSPVLQAWRKQQGNTPPPTSVVNRFKHPLIYAPGTSWSYGPSIDWAGVVIERVTGSASLQEYMQDHIWTPLGIKDMTFFLSSRPDMQARRTEMSLRTEDPEAIHSPVRQACSDPDMEDAQGGGGIFCSVTEYFKILHALLVETDDSIEVQRPRLLTCAGANALFEPQLGDSSSSTLMKVTEIPRLNHMMGNMPIGTRKDHALGGLLLLEDLKGWRSKHTLTWGGTPNLTWIIDRKAGLCALYASQIVPIGDVKSNEMVHAFEKAVYEHYASLDGKIA